MLLHYLRSVYWHDLLYICVDWLCRLIIDWWWFRNYLSYLRYSLYFIHWWLNNYLNSLPLSEWRTYYTLRTRGYTSFNNGWTYGFLNLNYLPGWHWRHKLLIYYFLWWSYNFIFKLTNFICLNIISKWAIIVFYSWCLLPQNIYIISHWSGR